MLQGEKSNPVTFPTEEIKKQDDPIPEESVPKSPEQNTIESEDSTPSDFSDSTVLYNTDRCEEKTETGKEDFFNTDNSSPEKQKREKTREDSDEDEELQKLLRMTHLNSHTHNTQNKETEERQQKEKKLPKTNEEVSLIDCLDSENLNNISNHNPDTKDFENENDFLSIMNSKTKEAFLLSSDESPSSPEEIEEKEQPKKEAKKQPKPKPKPEEVKKRQQDDLREFRVSNFSEKEDNTENEEDSSWKEDEESDESVKCVEFVKKQNRQTEQSTDSDSDIEQIPNNKIQTTNTKTEASPTKGRKNIKKILKKENLQVETKQALHMENERKKRVKERQELFDSLFPNSDKHSKFILDFDPNTKEELVVVDEELSRQLKPHQKEGVRFMWNCCFESVQKLEEDSGSGCILAHCMGLGKTLQVITLIHTVLTHDTGVHTALIICPLNTIRNWMNEFKTWLSNCNRKIKPIDLIPCKTRLNRIMKMRSWTRDGGVLIISYEMFRSFIKTDSNPSAFAQCLLDPGADLVVCDEGHVLKNSKSALSKCMSRIKTLRRIILTGTPLQNNLTEYYCMVQFVKPNILGTVKEFRNRFVRPIENGQFEDSTEHDVRLMKRRAHVLHTMLDGFIQRFGYYVLTPFLPEKQEYVISITLTESQEKMYRLFIGQYNQEAKSQGLLRDFHWMQKVWTHPRVMLIHANKHNIDMSTREQWEKYVSKWDYDSITSSGKLLLLFHVLKLSKEVGDKVLVFSQSLFSLNLIEYFLQKLNQEFRTGIETEFSDSWVLGEDYFRLDGSTNSENRDFYVKKFNNVKDSRFRLFLLSTKAGGLGISLVAANRVVVFDASWNPTHDVQSIFRVYRFGQNKPCYIYRFLAAATMEEKIYRRQVTKLSLAHRILDEHQIERHYTMGNLQELYTYDPLPKSEWGVPKVPKDKLFAEILTCRRNIIVGYHEHDSLLENKEEEELTEEERRAAWEDYEKDKLTPEFLQQANGRPPIPNYNMMNRYPFPSSSVVNPNHTDTQMCRIVDVRTLQMSEEGDRFRNDFLQQYCSPVGNGTSQFRPWHAPADGYNVNEM